MFDDVESELAGWVRRLGDLPEADDPTERLRVLEELKCAAEAVQAQAAVALDTTRRNERRARGVPEARLGEGVASEVGLARRESPNKGARQLGLGKVLVGEMPHTLSLMSTGRLSEWRATILARETACLSLEDRQTVDRELCATGRAAVMSDRELEYAARRLAAKLDNAAVAARARRAESERAVTIRPAPDSMAWVTTLLPVKQAVAVWAALKLAADHARSSGDPRGRGQAMADTLVERVTGREATEPVPVHIDLVMTDSTLFTDDPEPGNVPGFGPVPAEWARGAAHKAAEAGAAFVRRLFTDPETGELVAMESRSRTAPPGLSHFIAVRDGASAARPTAAHPSGTPTTSWPTPTAVPRAHTTSRAYASAATTRKRRSAGTRPPAPNAAATSLTSRHRVVTTIDHARPTHPQPEGYGKLPSPCSRPQRSAESSPPTHVAHRPTPIRPVLAVQPPGEGRHRRPPRRS